MHSMSVTYTVQVHVAQATVRGRIAEMKTMSVKPNVNWPDNKHYKIKCFERE